MDLLTSYDIELQVVRSAHPEQSRAIRPLAFLTVWKKWFMSPQEREAAAVEQLDKDLSVDVVKVTDTILVEYKNPDPVVAKRVLNSLVQAYLTAHAAVHHQQGQLDFFKQQAQQYKLDLSRAELDLANFPQKYHTVNPAQDRDITLQKLSDFRYTLHQSEVALQDNQNRMGDLQSQLATGPGRITTELKRSDNPQLMQQLKGTLLNLELKRIDLLSKFQRSYPLVQEVEKQIADTRAAIVEQENAPLKEATTDIAPTHLWLDSELAKAKADEAGLEARRAALQRVVEMYQARASDLDRKALIYHDLQREADSQESKYLMYVRKREEARVTDALDQRRMLNVAVAEAPIVPALPSHSPLLFGAVIFSFLSMVSCGTLWGLERFDPTLRSSMEIEGVLNIPVLAAIPLQNGHGNGHNGYLGDSTESGNGNGFKVS